MGSKKTLEHPMLALHCDVWAQRSAPAGRGGQEGPVSEMAINFSGTLKCGPSLFCGIQRLSPGPRGRILRSDQHGVC